jgi:hypothetical protein
VPPEDSEQAGSIESLPLAVIAEAHTVQYSTCDPRSDAEQSTG